MKKWTFIALALLLCLCQLAAAGAEGEYIAVLAKGEQHAFWQAVRQGCADAALDFSVNMRYYGPPTETDTALQVAALRTELDAKPAAIALAALDTESVMAELVTCVEQDIPVIGFDSGVPGAPAGAIDAMASTDNEAAAGIAAEALMALDGLRTALEGATAEEPVVIAVLSQDAVSESITARTTGFVNRMRALATEYGAVSVTGNAEWADEVDGAGIVIHVRIGETASDENMHRAATALLGMRGLRAVFCSNEGAAKGLLAATNDGADLGPGGRYEDLSVAGFDAGRKQKDAVRQGWFIGAVTQDPYMIGYKAVELAATAARGGAVADVDTGAHWYTATNIDDPEIALLVYD